MATPRTKKPDQKAVTEVFNRLKALYPDPSTELTYDSPFQLLVSVILSAQCTDARVNQTTPELFRNYPTAKDLAAAPQAKVEKLIHACGFFRQKAKSIISTSKDLVEKFGGQVPGELDALTTLAGVGRKTASVVLNQAFDVPAIAVDTHVKRVAHRLGWTQHTDPEKVEEDLKALLPEKWWSSVNGMLILHGRRICNARKPKCEECPVNAYCAFYQSTAKSPVGAGSAASSRPPRRRSAGSRK